MAKCVAFLLLGSFSLLLLYLCVSSVSASNRNEPVQSNIYYLQDYCTVSESKSNLEEKYRQRRSSSKYDYDDEDFDFFDGIHQVVGYAKRSIKNQIKREMKVRQKYKQVFLDLAAPSVVVKLWRPDSTEENQEHHKLIEDAPNQQKVSCKLLLRLSNLNESTANQTLGLLANSTMGAVVNFLKLNQKPYLNDYRLRIVSSDPNMTQYWLAGRKLNTASSANKGEEQQQLPVAVDLVTTPQQHPEPLMKEELSLLNKVIEGAKWLLIELDTINQTSDEDENIKEKRSSGQQKQQPEKDNTELVISLFTRSVRSANAALRDATQGSSDSSGNGTLKCPVGTFDCSGDGDQCIPSGLRCNGEDNCGSNYRLEELLNCGTVNLYYIFGGHHDEFDFESDGFWFAVRILVLLFLICLVLYMTSLLCRCCCDSQGRRGGHQIINGRSPMIYLRSAKGGPTGAEPLLAAGAHSRLQKSDASSSGAVRPASPPPSYFGNQMDNQKSNVQEYIYVNNNYGQPQGSTTVHTGVGVPVSFQGSGPASAPPPFDNFAPMYPKIEYPSYGSTQKQ